MTHQLNWSSIKKYFKYWLSIVYDSSYRWPYCCLQSANLDTYYNIIYGFKSLVVNGFLGQEVNELSIHLAEIILPRLKNFRKNTYSYPPDMSMEEWLNKLDSMIDAFEILIKDEHIGNKKLCDKMDKGLKEFGKYFSNLWI